MNIIVVNPFGIGDVLFSTPMISRIKEKFPDSKIGFICNKRTKPVLEANPDIDKLYVYEKDEFKLVLKKSKRKFLKKLIKFLFDIKKEKYDVVLDLSLASEYSFFLMLIGIKLRIGYNYKNRGKFLTVKINIDGYDKKHVADYNLNLLKYIGIHPESRPLRMEINSSDCRQAEKLLEENFINPESFKVALIPGGGVTWGKTKSYKHWPAEYYVQLADKLIDLYNAEILILGSDDEKKLCEYVAGGIKKKEKVFNLSGKTKIRILACLLKKCTFAVCNDGGPLHIAVSQNVKTVSFFGPVNEIVYGPYPRNSKHIVLTKNIICRPCYNKFRVPECARRICLEKIKPDEVITVINGFMKTANTGES